MRRAMDWWMWLATGLVLLVLELATPSGFFVMFFGLGALTVGVLTRLEIAGAAWTQWLLFITLSLTYLLLFRRQLQSRVQAPASKAVDSLVGTVAIAQERILPGQVGRVEVRGSAWSARNEAPNPIEPGQRCRVVGIDGLMLSIQPE
jgi:membrane protein implicated in regulation of membrane protease activity